MFVQDEIALVPDKLQLTLGTKIEHNDFTGWEIQPTGRLLWTTGDEALDNFPSWAPDGRHIVFTSNRSGSEQLWIMDTRSAVTRQLTHQSGAKYGAWSPRLNVR